MRRQFVFFLLVAGLGSRSMADNLLWTSMPSLTRTAWGHAAAVVSGTIYVVGGYNSYKRMDAYDTATQTWTTKTSLPVEHATLGAASIGGTVYAIGGWTSSGFTPISNVEAYDTATDSWTPKANMLKARDGLAAVALGGMVYAIGGYQSSIEATMEMYDPSTNTWVYKASMSVPRWQHAAAVLGGTIYVMGGAGNSGSQSGVEAYYPATNTWTSRAALPVALQNLAAATVGGTIYVMGGTIDGTGDRAVGTVYAYDSATNTWTSQPSLLIAPRHFLAAASVSNTLYVVGGIGSNPAGGWANEAGFLVAGLPGSLSLSPAPVSVGQWLTVWFTVTNSGSNSVEISALQLRDESGPALLGSIGSPTPGVPVTIAPGTNTTFSWTASVSGSGILRLVATASGTDTVSGNTLVATASTTTTALSAATLDSVLLVSADPVTAGDVLTLTSYVFNTGGSSATMYAPLLQFNSGGSAVVQLTGPSVSGPFVVNGGSSTTFVWTFSVTGVGMLSVTMTETGSYIATGAPLATSSSAVTTLNPAARLAAALAITPASASLGSLITVALTVTNTGVGSASLVTPSVQNVSSTWYAVLVAGPVPSGPVVLAAGSATTFVWTYSVTGTGTLGLSATVTGIDAASSVGLVASASASAVLVAGAQLLASAALSVPAVNAGQSFQLNVVVQNIGTLDALNLTPVLTMIGSGVVSILSAPAGYSATLAGGASQVLTWVFSAVSPGALQLTVNISATSAFDGSSLSEIRVDSIDILPVVQPYAGPLRVFPNPFLRAAAVRGTVKFEGLASGAAVRVYSAHGLLVWAGQSTATGSLEWDGRNGKGQLVAAGVYQWVVADSGGALRGRLVVE